MKRRYILLLLKAMECSRESAGTAAKYVAYCKKRKGESHNGHGNSDGGGSTSSNIKWNLCGLKGHKEAECYKKFPKKAPTW